MRKVALTILCSLLLVPSLAFAQAIDCPECLLGLWDEVGLVNNFGAMGAGTPKDLYLGVKVPPSETGLTGVEFSIAGIRQVEDGILVLGVTPLSPTMVVVGSAVAPADTSTTSAGTGRMNIAWPECQVITGGSLALARIQLLSFAPVVDKVFKVKRGYPTSNTASFPFNPVLVRCDIPTATTVKLREGCYIAGYSGTCPPTCCVGIEQQTWSGVKQLFND
jgi:hypothetical protein